MSRLLIIVLLTTSGFAYSQNKDYSYTYIELSATQSEDIGHIGDISISLPVVPIYFRGSIKEEVVESIQTIYNKTGEVVTMGGHFSISEILNSVTKFKLSKFVDIYAEIGVNKWELEDPTKLTETGTDVYAKAGLRTGNTSGWEFDLYLEQTRLVEPVYNPSTGVVDFSLSEETNNNLGIKVINHFRNRLSFSLGFNNDDFFGSSVSLGLRYSL
jgi:hypothetical protein